VPAAASSAAAAAQRQGKTTSTLVKSYVPTGKLYPGTSIRTATVRASVPGPSGESTSRPADVRGAFQPQSPPRYQESWSRRPAPRRQSPARGAPRHGRSTSPRGRHQTSRPAVQRAADRPRNVVTTTATVVTDGPASTRRSEVLLSVLRSIREHS